jgi:hypothetical protein
MDRTLDRLLNEQRQWMKTDEARNLYARRKQLSEPVFGILKEQMGARRFLLRSLVNVCAEFTLMATAFNLKVLSRVCDVQIQKPLEQKVIL